MPEITLDTVYKKLEELKRTLESEDTMNTTDQTTEQRPARCTEKHLEYLDELRESGVTNMFGARPYLQRRFSLEPKEAGAILAYWMRTFAERHQIKEAK